MPGGRFHRPAPGGFTPYACFARSSVPHAPLDEGRRENEPFSRVTLFPSETQASDVAKLEARLIDQLAEFAPDIVAVPGWADSAGLLALAWAARTGVGRILMSDSQSIDAPRRPWTERRFCSQAPALQKGSLLALPTRDPQMDRRTLADPLTKVALERDWSCTSPSYRISFLKQAVEGAWPKGSP